MPASMRFNRLLIAMTAAALAMCQVYPRTIRAAEPIRHEVYVWQRVWTEPVRQAIQTHHVAFASIVPLCAQVDWVRGEAQVTRVAVDFGLLRETKRPVGLALRIGPYAGGYSGTDKTGLLLTGLAKSVVAGAQRNGIVPRELQIDFDCASSKLDGYRVWVNAIRQAVAPVPVTITALPSWLDQPAFPSLAKETNGYVLQVHSLERPAHVDVPMNICDATLARQWTAHASRLGVPYRIALPTYGYLVGFDARGKFLGLSAEGPAKSWPRDARIRHVAADPVAMARLVADWSAERPPFCEGIVWYRLPVASDTLNWHWRTLERVMTGNPPRSQLEVVAQQPKPGLFDIELVNSGDADVSLDVRVRASWSNAKLLAHDTLFGFDLVDISTTSVVWGLASGTKWQSLAVGERRGIGWLRFTGDKEVRVHVEVLGTK
jgi:hypothetical protein